MVFLKSFHLFKVTKGNLVLSKDFCTLMFPNTGKKGLKLTWIHIRIFLILFLPFPPLNHRRLKNLVSCCLFSNCHPSDSVLPGLC